jgi:3-phosphoshikimate 1-carboxyvinyltransferase
MHTTVERTDRLRGALRMPGDKSVAHRALILGALARGMQTIEGLPASEDVASTASCLRSLGCRVDVDAGGRARISSRVRLNGEELFAGNSGTTARLIAGLVAGRDFVCTIDGDESLRRRPMGRIAEPLALMGADVETSPAGTLPMRIRGGGLTAIEYRPPVASAQVKSAVLIAGLRAEGDTAVVERVPTRDHTENLLAAMGAVVDRSPGRVQVSGGAELRAIHVRVPGDISSAAFFIAAAVLCPDSEVRIVGAGVNPTRTGILEALGAMGADVSLENVETSAGEPIADIVARSSALRGTDVAGPVIPRVIDELPLLAVVATQAEGTTTVRDAAELRHKESDRISAIVENLRLVGADIEELEDGFVVRGPTRLVGGRVSSLGDHRIAMAMAVAGLRAGGETTIDGSEAVGVSYPGFFRDLESLVA